MGTHLGSAGSARNQFWASTDNDQNIALRRYVEKFLRKTTNLTRTVPIEVMESVFDYSKLPPFITIEQYKYHPYYYEKGWDHISVVSVIFRSSNGQQQVLLLNVGGRLDQWDFPGGTPKAREPMDSALKRIMQEEAGLMVSRVIEFVGVSRFRAPWYTGFQKCQKVLFVVETKDHDIMLNTKKHRAFCWANFGQIRKMCHGATKVKDIKTLEMVGNEARPKEYQWFKVTLAHCSVWLMLLIDLAFERVAQRWTRHDHWCGGSRSS